MSQKFKWLFKSDNLTDLSTVSGNTYVMGKSGYIAFHNNMSTYKSGSTTKAFFTMYMPDTSRYIYATTAIKFHDCYKVGNTGYAHASFGFIAPGYMAGFPISFGFAGVNKAGSVWSMGQMQCYTTSDSTYTAWTGNFEISFGWPTEPLGVVPFISLGGVPFYQRFYTSGSSNQQVRGYEGWSGGNITSHTRSLGVVSSANSDADGFASNAFNTTWDGWDYNNGNGSTAAGSAKSLCPVDFVNWTENADSSFIGGWINRQGQKQGEGAYLGTGTVFCTDSTSTYGSALTYSNAAFQCSVKVWVYDSAGKPQRAKQVYVYNSSGAPVKAKHLYVYNSSGVPVQVF